MRHLVEQIDKDLNALLTKWSDDEVRKRYLLMRLDTIEWFFRQRIDQIIKDPVKTRCCFKRFGFLHNLQVSLSRAEFDVNTNFVRLLYLSYGEDKFITPINYNYSDEETKVLLFKHLFLLKQSTSHKPIQELKRYVVDDVCVKLEQRDAAQFECLCNSVSVSLPIVGQTQFNLLKSLKYQGAVIYRWFTRLEQKIF